MKKKLFLLTITVMLFIACNTNNPVQSKLIGTWQIDSISANKDSVNQTITFDEKTLTYYFGPNGDETWGGELRSFDYLVDSKQMIIAAHSPYNYTFQTAFYIENDTLLKIERFSLDGTNYNSLFSHKIQ